MLARMALVLSRCFLTWPKPGWEPTFAPHHHMKGLEICVCVLCRLVASEVTNNLSFLSMMLLSLELSTMLVPHQK